MDKELYRIKFIGELENFKKSKMLLFSSQMQKLKRDEANNTSIKINAIEKYIGIFDKYISSIQHEVRMEDFKKGFSEILDKDLVRHNVENENKIKSKDYKGAYEETLLIEIIEEIKTLFIRFNDLIEV